MAHTYNYSTPRVLSESLKHSDKLLLRQKDHEFKVSPGYSMQGHLSKAEKKSVMSYEA